MSSPRSDPGGLETTEGVDEGSALSAAEGPRPDTREEGLLGEPPRGAPADESQAAGPVDVEGEQARAERAAHAPGQELQEGEG